MTTRPGPPNPAPPPFVSDKTKIEHDEYDNECHCCGYKADDLEWYPRRYGHPDQTSTYHRDHFHLFCHICASTFLSRAIQYPGRDTDLLHRSLGWIANHLVAEIRKLKL